MFIKTCLLIACDTNTYAINEDFKRVYYKVGEVSSYIRFCVLCMVMSLVMGKCMSCHKEIGLSEFLYILNFLGTTHPQHLYFKGYRTYKYKI